MIDYTRLWRLVRNGIYNLLYRCHAAGFLWAGKLGREDGTRAERTMMQECLCIRSVCAYLCMQECLCIRSVCALGVSVHIKAHTDRARFGNATRIFSFQKQIKPSTDKNFTRYAGQIAGFLAGICKKVG
jgi:hypothetical protein